MLKFIVKRCLQAIPTLLVLITVSFFMMRLAPGSPFTTERNLSPEVLANIEAKYGFDKPIYQQYGRYLANLLHGDFGPSFRYKDHSVTELVHAALPVSLEVGFYSFVLAAMLGIGAGVIAAMRQNSLVDYGVMGLAMVGVMVPNFVKAPLLIIIFSICLKWLPAGGWNDGTWPHLILPVATLALGYMSTIGRITRSSMIEVLNTNFIRTARAKGLPTSYIIWRHALKPAMLPVVAYLGPAFVGIITGSIVIETIFGLPGIGQLFVNGALNRDYSMVLAITILVGALTIFFGVVVDILYAVIDPKIRY